MSTTLYVGGLPYAVGDPGLIELFAPHGAVQCARVDTDTRSGQARGFSFVEMATSDEAEQAIVSLNGVKMDGHTLTVRKALFQNKR